MTLDELSAALRAIPGVRDAQLVSEEQGLAAKRLVGYIVPDTSYIEGVLAEADEERKRIQKWRKTFDLMQLGKEAAAAPLAFNIAGWNSSYTRQPIPPEEMREWVEETVRDIKSLVPKEVLEIGCGTGLLLLRIAPDCQRYVATDFAPAVLQRLREQMAQLPAPLPGITLLERAADNFEGFAPASFDTVILNSVIQHFPSLSYLLRVLEQLVAVVRPGGKILIGDVRSLPLLEAYAASVELFQAPETMSLRELRDRVRRRVRQQEQLVISPSFFLALQKRFPRISRVEVRPKRGQSDNELTRFRFNAVLSIDAMPEEPIEPQWADWPAQGISPARLQQMLRNSKCQSLALRGVPNARIQTDLAALAAIAKGEPSRSSGELKRALQEGPSLGILPEKLWDIAAQSGFSLDWSCVNSCADGRLDLFFERRQAATEACLSAIAWPRPAAISEDLARHANVPGQTILAEKLIQSLHAFSKEKFPANLVPSEFVLVDAIPRRQASHQA